MMLNESHINKLCRTFNRQSFQSLVSSNKCLWYLMSIQLTLVSMVCFPHKFFMYMRKTYRGNWEGNVEIVAQKSHVLCTSNSTCSIPYAFFINYNQSEDSHEG